MRRFELHLPGTALISVVAALTTWVTLWAWSPFSERPSTFLVPLLGVSLLVAALGAFLRGARLPALGVLLLQLVLVGLVLHHTWADGLGLLGGWLPTPTSLREVGAVLSASVDASRSYPAPVPKSVPEFPPVLILAGSATAVLVDFIACGLRRAPVAGLPLLAAYTAPVSILDGGVSWVKFALAGLLFLFLITCQEAGRLAHWGQQVTGSGRFFDTQQAQVSSHAVWSSARKIGFTATGLAVVVPILVPTWTVSLFDGNGPGRGNGDAVSITNPIVNMRRDLNRGLDVDLVRVSTADPDPRYLRVSVLDEFDGETWKPSNRSIPVDQRADGLVPTPPGLDARVQSTTYKWDVELTDNFSSTWLPAPYPVFSLTAPGDWRYNRDTLDFISGAKDQPSEGLRYQLERIDVNPTPEELAFAAPAPATVFGPGTELPDGIPESVKALAQSVTEGARTKWEKAVALQDWFRTGGGFEYSLEPAPGNGVDDLVRFLDERVGYCEQFAGAMALMGRSLAIPSRVAVGFLRPDPVGDPSGDRRTYVYSAHDLHAWPEMYFDGVGWVPLEPTPGVRTGRAPGYTQQGVDRSRPSASNSASALLPSGQNRIDRSSAPAAGGRDSGAGSVWSTPAFLGGAAGTLLLLVLLALPRTARSWVRSRRWAAATTTAGAAEAGWAELRDTALDLNLAFDDRRTVRTVARELVRSFGVPGSDDDALAGSAQRGPGANPDAEAALRRIVEQVERARFARDVPVDAGRVDALRDDVERCVAAMGAGVGRRRRARASWLPASLWSGWSLGGRTHALRRDVHGEPGVDHAI